MGEGVAWRGEWQQGIIAKRQRIQLGKQWSWPKAHGPNLAWLSDFASKALLEVFIRLQIVYGRFGAAAMELSNCNKDHYNLHNLKYLLSCPLRKQFLRPCVTPLSATHMLLVCQGLFVLLEKPDSILHVLSTLCLFCICLQLFQIILGKVILCDIS